MKFLLDTNICLYLINKKPTHVFEKFKTHAVGDIGVSVITSCELAYGVAHSQRPTENKLVLQEFLAPLEVLGFPMDAAAVYGDMRADLKRRGCLLGPLDMLIAAHALYANYTLVTNNEREFEKVSGLTIENWVRKR